MSSVISVRKTAANGTDRHRALLCLRFEARGARVLASAGCGCSVREQGAKESAKTAADDRQVWKQLLLRH